MDNKIDIHNFWRSNIFIVLMLAVISIFSGILVWHGKFVVVSPDFYFHWQRIYELKDSMINGNLFPAISINEFNQSGSAVMSMYPMLNLFPMIFLSFFIQSFINLFYIIFILKNFFALLVGYYSCYSYIKNKKISFLFSISYVLTTFVFTLNTLGYDIGVTSAIIFLPLVLFGSFELLSNNGWKQLTLGMSAIILCHVLTAMITIMFLTIFFIVNIKKVLHKERIINLCKAIIFTIFITSIYWIPFLYLQTQNEISLPPNFLLLDGTSANDFVSTVFDFSVYPLNISLFSFIGLVISIINYKKLNSFSKQIFWISISFMLLCSKLFPWSIVQHTFVRDIIQAPWRFYVVPQLLLSYLFSENIITMLKNNTYKTMYYTLIILSIIAVHLGFQQKIVNTYKTTERLIHPYNTGGLALITSNKEFDNIINDNMEVTDYYPKESLSYSSNFSEHQAVFDNNKKHLLVSLFGNGKFSFTSPQKINKLSLPFLYYNGIDYQVKLDGKTVKDYPNENALMTINNVRKGKHHVQIIVHKTKAEIASYILSLIGLLILIGAILKNFLKKRKNK